MSFNSKIFSFHGVNHIFLSLCIVSVHRETPMEAHTCSFGGILVLVCWQKPSLSFFGACYILFWEDYSHLLFYLFIYLLWRTRPYLVKQDDSFSSCTPLIEGFQSILHFLERKGNVTYLPLVTEFSTKLVFNLAEQPILLL